MEAKRLSMDQERGRSVRREGRVGVGLREQKREGRKREGASEREIEKTKDRKMEKS